MKPIRLMFAPLLAGALLLSVEAQQIRQPPEVVAAYRVCAQFQQMMSEDLNFSRAFDATFTQDPARRRAVAIAEGEFGDLDFTNISDDLLIRAFKSRMQIMYLLFPLASPGEEDVRIFFPPAIEEILKRPPPKKAEDFPAYVAQLDQDAAHFRAHLDRLAAAYPGVAARLRRFKTETLATDFEPPQDSLVEPSHSYYRSGVLKEDEPFYEINGYAVANEQGHMRIIGIRFFSRLF